MVQLLKIYPKFQVLILYISDVDDLLEEPWVQNVLTPQSFSVKGTVNRNNSFSNQIYVQYSNNYL